jgi:hypothetical protein
VGIRSHPPSDGTNSAGAAAEEPAGDCSCSADGNRDSAATMASSLCSPWGSLVSTRLAESTSSPTSSLTVSAAEAATAGAAGAGAVASGAKVAGACVGGGGRSMFAAGIGRVVNHGLAGAGKRPACSARGVCERECG